MVQYQEPVPLEKRASKHITVGQFLQETWPVPAAWLGGGVAGWLFAKARKLGTSTPKGQLAMMIPAKLGAFIALFMIWQKKEKENIGIHEIYDTYKDARAMRMTNDDIAKDNAVLKQMVEYEERQLESPKHVQDILAHGPQGHAEHAADKSPEVAAGR